MVVKEQYINLKGWQATMFYLIVTFLAFSEFIWQFLRPYTGTIPNPKKAYIFPILCILGIIFPKSLKFFSKYKGKGSFPKSQIKSLSLNTTKQENISANKNIKQPFAFLVLTFNRQKK